MLLKIIACEVLFREICFYAAQSPHVIDLEFTDKGAHEKAETLRQLIQGKIDQSARGRKKYDAVLLGFGLCGNSILDLKPAGCKLIIPRAHDCCTLFLGSRAKFAEHFKANPSLPFSSAGYMERDGTFIHLGQDCTSFDEDAAYQEYVERYGEENAKFLMESMHPKTEIPEDNRLMFINTPTTANLDHADKCRTFADQEGWAFVEVQGESGLIEKLVMGEWDEADFLFVEPGETIAGVYDWEEIIKAEDQPAD